MKLGLATIEDAIIAAIQADPTIAEYKPWVGPFQARFDEARKAGRAMRLPAIGVCWIGGQHSPAGMFRFKHAPRFQITCSARNLRGPREAKTGTASEVGVYQMMEDIWDLLSGNDLGVDGLSELIPVETEPVEVNADDLTVQYAVIFETRGLFGRDDPDQVAPATVGVTFQTSDGTPVVTDEHPLGEEAE